MTREFQDMSVENLVELLSQNTVKFTHLMMDGQFSEEYDSCKAIIQELQEIISLRGAIRNSLLDN
jgi:hypothetical protein